MLNRVNRIVNFKCCGVEIILIMYNIFSIFISEYQLTDIKYKISVFFSREKESLISGIALLQLSDKVIFKIFFYNRSSININQYDYMI